MPGEDFHVHSDFSDGKNSPEEVISSALEKGMTRLGFSDHGWAWCDRECCIPLERMEEYRSSINSLKSKYAGRIEILCGLEQDYMSELPAKGFDYVIGSVHYVLTGGEYISVDNTADIVRAGIEKHFGGDPLAFAEEYFRLVSDVYEKTGCSIIGHFDLLTKFNERTALFDTSAPRYIAAWKAAADKLLKTGCVFEINTGAIARGYRTSPYPAGEIMRYIAGNGGRFILSSDSHRAENLCFEFEKWESFAESLGIAPVSFCI